jgi:molybdopterin-dependent oxidoreductase alpha subunit
MARRVRGGGGWPAVFYSLRLARKVGPWKFWRAMNSKNACKTCALGMGGQLGPMRNEAGSWPEVCKKSMQAAASDLQGAIRPEFFQSYSIDQLRTFSPRELENAGRLTRPMILTPGADRYRPIDWTEALERLADRFKAISPNEAFFYFSGRSSNEAAFLLQLFARVWGTNNVNNCSYYCHQASGVGLSSAIGTGTATVALDDVERADLVFLLGGNPASNHPRFMTILNSIRRKGGRVVVVNPVREPGLIQFRIPSNVRSLLFGSRIADLYLQPHIGGDVAALTGVAKVVIERGGVDASFVAGATEGFEAFEEFCRSASWAEIEAKSGLGRGEIEQAAEMYLAAQNVVFAWTMGITHHEHGVENVWSIVNLALLRGMVGRPHAGLLPIRGHSNVQGIGSMGVAPELKERVFAALQSEFGVKLPAAPGYDTFASIEAADRGAIRLAVCLGGNLFGANPDAQFAARAIQKIDTVVYFNTTLNTGHAWGTGATTFLLPVLARDEEPQPTTQESMFNYVRLSDGGPARHAGPKSEVEAIASLAQRVLGDDGPVDWNSMREHRSIRSAVAKIIPGYGAIGRIDETKKEFHIEGRILHSPRFDTPSGRARFHVHPIPDRRASPGKLRLMTVRSEGQFNTVVYDEDDLYRGQERRDVILMNPQDVRRLGLRVDQPVAVKSAAGRLSPILVREFDVRAGNAVMYYPEANVLVPAVVDPRSKTPAFKSVEIEIEPVAAPTGLAQFTPVDALASART